ncbi:MAG: thiamine-phosphate kinase, partial [Desulfurobacteriaceae bacterium]
AMGGEAKYALVTLGVSESSKVEDLEALYKGLSDASAEYNVDVVGGDTVRSEGEFFDLFLLGESRKFMKRSGAKPGELVAVTGTFGDSKAGLELIEKGKEIRSNFLINRFLNPTPRLREGKEAVKMGVKCGTDVSDGLIFNLYTIAESSKVSIFIDSDRIPMSEELLSFCKERKRNPLEYALFGGEDYELIITFPNNIEKEITELGFKVIGKTGKGSGVFLDGELISKKGFDHFRRE